MLRQLRFLKDKLKRNFLKPINKKLIIYCPTMHSEGHTTLPWKTVFMYILYTVVICTLCVTMWTVSSDDVVSIGLSSNVIIKAVYKYSKENSDGSIDLVFNVPRGGDALLRLNSLHINTLGNDEENPGNETTISTAPTTTTSQRPQVKTMYPMSLDAAYAINTVNVCPEGQQVDYIIIVHSATAYFARRRAIRETFGGKGLFRNIFQRVVFLLGTTSDPVTSKAIREEAFLYRDIVQGQFIDSYHNLTHKGVLGYRWISEHCPQAKIIVKIDDDVFVNPFKLVQDVLPNFLNKTRHIGCHLRPGGTSPIVRGKGRWQVHDDEFRGQTNYPFDYCNGYFVIITSDLIRPMLNAARLNPFFWIDDVYLFGILPATVGQTKFVDIRENLSLTFNSGKQCYEEHGTQCKLVAVSQWKAEEPEKLWYMVLSNLTVSAKNQLQVFGLS
uniref:Hexosyltransferase n=1 Tax=Arion vulgaris TaxID=1028688 RepID=A0A0B7ADB3_9EUPU